MLPPASHGRDAGAAQRSRSIDGLRAVAAASVLVSHCSGLTGFAVDNHWLGPLTARLNVGVTIFFVLSGYLLYRPFALARLAGRPFPSVKRYAGSRVRRILPAYWLALTVLALWPGLPGVFTGDWWRFYGLSQNLSSSTIISGLGPAWSLAVEASFYVALPLLALASARAVGHLAPERQLRVDLALLGAFAAASLVVRTIVHASRPGSTFANTLGGTFLWFALGMAVATGLAYLSVTGAAQPRWLQLVGRHGVLLAFLVLLASTKVGLPVSFADRYTGLTFLLEHVLFGAVAVLLLVAVVTDQPRQGLARRALGAPAVAWMGTVSYGIFLWHLPLIPKLQTLVTGHLANGVFFATTLLSLAVSTAIAAVSFYALERPVMRAGRRPASVAEPGRIGLSVAQAEVTAP